VTGLKGKTVGVPSLADAGLLQYTRTLAASVGLEATDFKFLGVGVGSPGALALQQKRIDALALWDTLQASLENQGMSFRRLETPVVHELFGQSLAARDDYIEQHADILIGLARGIAKATVFGLANPEASVRIHWKMYPQTRPQSGDDATLLKSAINVFNSRFASQRVDHRDDKRFGAATIAQWRALEALQRKYGVITGPVRPEDLYTDRLIEAINAFDQQAIVREARAYKAAN
jgi:NitT/TauT family transport system substrate-binding protein